MFGAQQSRLCGHPPSLICEFTLMFAFILQIGNSVGVSGGYGGFSASLKVDVNTFKQSIDEGSTFMSDKTVLTSGGSDLPEPIRVQLMPIYKAIHYDFFKHPKNPRLSGCDSAQTVAEKSENVKKILKEYPKLKAAGVAEGNISHRTGKRERSAVPFTTSKNDISRSPLPQCHRPGNSHLCQTFHIFKTVFGAGSRQCVYDCHQKWRAKGRGANISCLDSYKIFLKRNLHSDNKLRLYSWK